MLEKPDLPDDKILDSLRGEYGLKIVEITFLPLGADVNTAVYRAVTDEGTPYFVKLRRGVFNELTVQIPKLLHDQGIRQIIAPLPTQSGQLWAELDEYKVTLSPFIEGQNGYEAGLTEQQWVELGHVLKAIHTTAVPPSLMERIPKEMYSPQWRESVRRFQAQAENTTYADPVSAELAAFLKLKREVISRLVDRAERLAAILQTRLLPFVLCHADIHAWNVLIGADGALYVVDWDTLTFAPKERDLMFIGGGLYRNSRSPEETLFYQGYGQTQIDHVALAYYRYERIVQDIAAYCEQILLTQGDSPDRAEGLRQLMSQFQPNEVVEIAFETDKKLPPI